MSQKYMNKSEFARFCGVTPTAITAAVKDGRIVISSNGMIDANRTNNMRYKAKQEERKAKLARGKTERKLFAERNPERRENLERIRNTAAPNTPFENFQPPPQNQIPSVYDESEKTEIDYAIEKMRSTTALNKARLAEMVRATIRRDFVDTVISLIGTSISDHLITMGDRLSSDIAAIAGSTEASVIRKIKEEIDADITAAIVEMKTVIERRYKESLEQ